MKPTAILGLLFTLLLSPVFAAEEIAFNYTFEGNVRQDFSNIPKGPLRIGEFTDSRGVDNPNLAQVALVILVEIPVALKVGIPLIPTACQPYRKSVAHGDIEHTSDFAGVVVTHSHVGAGEKGLGIRLGRDDIDRAHRRVTAKQGTLRPTQHFHALVVEHQRQDALHSR